MKIWIKTWSWKQSNKQQGIHQSRVGLPLPRVVLVAREPSIGQGSTTMWLRQTSQIAKSCHQTQSSKALLASQWQSGVASRIRKRCCREQTASKSDLHRSNQNSSLLKLRLSPELDLAWVSCSQTKESTRGVRMSPLLIQAPMIKQVSEPKKAKIKWA